MALLSDTLRRYARSILASIALTAALAGCSGGAPSPQSIASSLFAPCGPPVGYTDLAWSPDSTRIAFTMLTSNGSAIAVMSANGGGMRTLSNPAGSSYSPRWSPDGRQLVFVTETMPDQAAIDAGEAVARRIDIINIDGSGQKSITPPGDYYMPSWSDGPGTAGDGARIVFALKQDDNMDLFLMDGDGANVTQLTTAPGDDRWPVWSPDGTRIAFIGDRTQQPGLYVINRDGTGETRLDVRPVAFPSWSRDGSMLAYGAPYQGMGIYVIPVGNPAVPWSPDPAMSGEPPPPRRRGSIDAAQLVRRWQIDRVRLFGGYHRQGQYRWLWTDRAHGNRRYR